MSELEIYEFYNAVKDINTAMLWPMIISVGYLGLIRLGFTRYGKTVFYNSSMRQRWQCCASAYTIKPAIIMMPVMYSATTLYLLLSWMPLSTGSIIFSSLLALNVFIGGSVLFLTYDVFSFSPGDDYSWTLKRADCASFHLKKSQQDSLNMTDAVGEVVRFCHVSGVPQVHMDSWILAYRALKHDYPDANDISTTALIQWQFRLWSYADHLSRTIKNTRLPKLLKLLTGALAYIPLVLFSAVTLPVTMFMQWIKQPAFALPDVSTETRYIRLLARRFKKYGFDIQSVSVRHQNLAKQVLVAGMRGTRIYPYSLALIIRRTNTSVER